MLKLLASDGWVLKNVEGSHRQFVHPTKPGKVTVAGKSSVTIPRGTETSILRQAGLKRNTAKDETQKKKEG
jgi:predicted RNA binding protein YcfA (HicA-like mRNA interferase family)